MGGAFLSSGGILIRNIEHTDPWAILFYRSIGFVALLLSIIVISNRKQTFNAFVKIGKYGVSLAIALSLGFVCYVFAMLLTTVANVAIFISAGPLFTALLSWTFLRERVFFRTWVVIFFATIGMVLMFSDSVNSGQVLGSIIALVLPISFAVMVVMIRSAGDISMVPATCLAGMFAAVIGLCFAENLFVTLYDLRLLIILGMGQLGLGFLFITMGTRYVPAAESALLSLSETFLAPILAWIFLSELPSLLGLIGGVIVVFCVCIQGVSSMLYGPKS